MQRVVSMAWQGRLRAQRIAADVADDGYLILGQST